MNEPTIGGIPAKLFIGRRIKFRSTSHSNKQYPMPGQLLTVRGEDAEVRPDRHKRSDWIKTEDIEPWWAINNDLRKKHTPMVQPQLNTLSKAFEKAQQAVQAPAQLLHPTVPQPPAPRPPVPAAAPVEKPWQPLKNVLSITIPGDAPASWQVRYGAYCEHMKKAEEAAIEAELHTEAAEDDKAALEAMGIVFGKAQEAVATKVKKAPKAAKEPKAAKKPKRKYSKTASKVIGGRGPVISGERNAARLRDWLFDRILKLKTGSPSADKVMFKSITESTGISYAYGARYLLKRLNTVIATGGLKISVSMDHSGLNRNIKNSSAVFNFRLVD